MNINVLLKYIYHAITVVSLVVVGLSVKYLLGGYDEIIIKESDAIDYVIAGRYIDHTWSDEDKESWQEELTGRITGGKMKGRQVVIAFFPDSLKTASPVRFSGIAMGGNIVTIPPGYQVVDINEPKGLETLLRMHPLVRPELSEVRAKMIQMASKKGLKLDERLLLFYGQKDSLTVKAGFN